MKNFYGRKKDLGKIIQVFEAVQRGGSGAVLVCGPAGSGKTALVTRFAVEAETAGALFSYGKADILNRSAPFSTLTTAMNMLVKKAIAEKPQDMDGMRTAVGRALMPDFDPDTGVAPILNLVPALSYLFGEFSASPNNPAIESSQWINLRLLSVLEAFAAMGRPMILFLDDLQWLDEASHDFLRYLAINGLVPGMLLILAFRSENSKKSSALELTADFYQSREYTRCLTLSGLTKRDTRGLLRARLGTDQNLTPLADVCHRKTAGNPFYLTQLLEELLEKDLIQQQNREWIYDISLISDLEYTENVVDLMIERMRLLDSDCMDLLKQASCLQSDLSVPLLKVTSGFSRERIETLLWKPVQQDLLQKTEEGFRFAHDRISESLEALIHDDDAEVIHRRLVIYFLAEEQRHELENNIFTLLFHYDFYADSVSDGDVKIEMTRLYFMAGEQARNRSAYTPALKYFKQGKDHFPGNMWVDDYQLAIRFSRQLAECAYLAGDFVTADHIFTEAEANAKSFSDRLAVEMVKIPCYHTQEKEEKALEAGLNILNRLGFRISKNPSGSSILYSIFKAWIRFLFSRKDRLKHKRMDPDSDVYKAVKCLSALGVVAYNMSPQKLLPLMMATIFNMTLKYGNMEEAPVAYMGFGMILNEMTGTVKWGRTLGAMARQISLDFSDDRHKTKEITIINVFLDHWNKPLSQAIIDFNKAEAFCLRQGDHEYFAYNALGHLHGMMISNVSLATLLQEIGEKKKGFKRINNKLALTTAGYMQQAIANLELGVREPWILTGEYFDETLLGDRSGGILTDLYLYKFCAAFYCGRTDIASEIRENLVTCDEMAMDAYQYNYYQFLCALLDICLKSEAKKIKHHLKQLKKYAAYNEAFYGNKYLLALGDSMRIKGDPKAVTVYREAVAAAQTYGFRFEQALAWEGIGMIAKNNGDDATAREHFTRAIRLYKQWGLKWKQGLFDHKRRAGHTPEEIITRSNPTTSEQTGLPAGLLKNAGESVGEGRTNNILRTMKIISGATAIHAATQRVQYWKSHVYIDDNGIQRPATFVPLPEKMLAFACATGEVIRSDIDSFEEELLDTAYFWKHRPLSLLVIPGAEQNGIYLENFNPNTDIEALIRLAEQVWIHLRPNPAISVPMQNLNTADNGQLKERCRVLQDYMTNLKAYRNQSLSLSSLAKAVKMPQRSITNALNSCLEQNFHTFVNSYRIEAVKQALCDPANKDKTILEIAYAQGFNSKSTFNEVFKEIVGTTPSKFRTGMFIK
ncbi:MAG: AAA family ATPase [Desulfobacteraceae bacterium]|nr:AAA family ATPase [Desulfobacteraceae bacterium]